MAGAFDPAGVAAALAAGRTVHLWERRAGQLRAFLAERDWSEAVRSGALRWHVDTDLAEVARLDAPWVVHPTAAAWYRRELAWRGRGGPVAFVVDGGLLVDEVGEALAAAGYRVWTWETSQLPMDELRRQAVALQPALVVAINFVPGLAEAVAAFGIPGVKVRFWEIDPALDPVGPPRGPIGDTFVGTWRRAQVARFQANRWPAGWLPLATDPDARAPTPGTAAHAAPVAFVGRSMVPEARDYRARLVADVAEAEGWRPEEAEAAVEQVLAAQRASPDAYVVPALLAARCPSLRWLIRRYDPVHLAGEVAAAEHRLTVIARLGSLGVQVWGDPGWSLVAAHGVTWRGPAGTRHDIPRIYSNGGVHVDVGRLYQLDIVTLRVFEVLSCGGFLIAHHSPDLPSLFSVGVELESWQTTDELREKVAFYAERPDLRAAIGARGRERVRRDHTVRQRLAALALGVPQPGDAPG